MTSLPLEDPRTNRLDWRDVLNKLGPVLGLLFVFALFTALVNLVPRAQRFATAGNAELMLRQTAVVGIAALGMTMIIIAGGIDLSVGVNIALSTVVIARVLEAGLPPTLAALAGIATAALCGGVTGTLITVLKLSPFIVTLGMWAAVRGVAKGMAGLQVVYPPASWRESWLSGLVNTLPPERRWMLVPPGVWLMVILGLLIAFILRYTRFGRHVFAIGSNEQTARLCGVAVERTKLLMYVLAGALTGVAGILEFSYVSAGDPTTRSGAELDVIAAVVIGGAALSGGQGSIFGSLTGALMMTMVNNGCNKLNLPNWVQEIVTGIIIIIAAALDRLRHRRM